MVDFNAINIADYRLVCRTCLALDGDFLNLNESCKVEASKNMSYLECLSYCMHMDNLADMPGRICSECSAALKVTYTFMYNAWRAQQILKNKLQEIDQKKDSQLYDEGVDIKKPKRFRCKVCNVKVETKRSLKNHIKLHLDLISYDCQLCVYETAQRDMLNEHYQAEHGVEASKELLKPIAKTISDTKSKQQQQQQQQQQTVTDEPLIQREVVIEYINTHNPEADLNDNLVLENATATAAKTTTSTTDNSSIINEANASTITTSTPAPDSECVQMDVDDFIVEDAANNTDDDQNGFEIVQDLNAAIESITTAASTSSQDGSMTLQFDFSTSLVCKICNKEFHNQQQLKLHMLTHEEIPHFFCERCTFYTFFKIDLQQHYRNKHNMTANRVQLQPRNSFQPIEHFNDILLKCSFGCDMCLFDCSTQAELKQHYNDKHKAEANDVQLRPHNLPPIPTSKHYTSAADVFSELKSEDICSLGQPPEQNGTNIITESQPDYPNGLSCKKCYETFFYRKKLYEHYKKHSFEENATAKKAKLSKGRQQKEEEQQQPSIVHMLLKNANAVTVIAPGDELDIPCAAEIVTTTTTTLSNHISAIPPLPQLNSASHAIPSDAIPQIVETDQTVVDNFVFDFNNDTIFEEFDDDVDLDAETTNANAEGQHSHDSDALYLTSDEETDEQQQIRVVSYCVQCQKNFISQYQFENHMFIHRGLAPYRCEMCTNLYNTKKALIRHYKAVHKKVPTRDMIQAKGDKALNINQNELNMDDVVDSTGEDKIKIITLMCAKCPFETHDYDTLTSHLNTCHGISDESYIIQKLPYECPKCIRSFVSKSILLKHIEHNHSNVLPTKQPCIRSPPPQQQSVPFNIKNTITTNQLNISANTINSTTTMDNSMSELTDSSTGCGKVYKFITAKPYDNQMCFAHNQHFHQHLEQ